MHIWINKGRKSKRDAVLEELNKQPTDILCLALVYALNIKNYGIDVTVAWDTATQNCTALERAYIKGVTDTKEEMYKIFDDEISCDVLDNEG